MNGTDFDPNGNEQSNNKDLINKLSPCKLSSSQIINSDNINKYINEDISTDSNQHDHLTDERFYYKYSKKELTPHNNIDMDDTQSRQEQYRNHDDQQVFKPDNGYKLVVTPMYGNDHDDVDHSTIKKYTNDESNHDFNA